jgi:N-acetylglucosamine-6-phosphate deacetylase
LTAIERAAALGIRVSLGHTNASAEVLRAAQRAGATGFTHLGNGCPQQMDRHDNILWRVLDRSGLAASVIPDQIHVSPTLFRLMHRLIPAHQLLYTTDAMAAAGAKPGRYTLGPMELDVGEDQVVRLPGRTNYAGSALRPIDGVFRAARMLGCGWRDVWFHFSQVPAAFLGLPSGLAVGRPATFCLLKLTENGDGGELGMVVEGRELCWQRAIFR